MNASEEALLEIRRQHRLRVPNDEILVPKAIAYAMMLECKYYTHDPLLGFDEATVFGYRIGEPCPMCGRRKKNKGKNTCDGCGCPR